jgi:HK97 family phage major capsid protein
MRKKILEQRMARLTAKKQKLSERCDASTDVNEVRSLTEQLADVNAEMAETQAELDAIASEEAEERSLPPMEAQPVNAGIVAAFGQKEVEQKRENEDEFSTMEYRKAFMAYVQRSESSELISRGIQTWQARSGAAANTDSLGALIPTTLVNEFINEVKKVYGQLYNKVRKLNIPGGVRFPLGELEANFRWISESTVSPEQDGGKTEDVVFEYNIGEIRVAQTLLASITTIDAFEREVVSIMIKAFLQGMDIGIVKGTGKGQMLGILNDPRVMNQEDHIIELSAAEINNWTAWRKKFFSKLPLGYRAGEFIFPVATVDAYLETMADANNNPIFRQATGLEVNDGDASNPNGRFFGREVALVEPDVIVDFDSASNGDVIGIYWQPDQYAINTNMAMGMRRYFDERTNKWVDKLLVVVDGKVLNPKGFYIFKKKA